MRNRCYSIWFLAFIATLASLYMTAVVVVDPYGHFRTKVFPGVSWNSRNEKIGLFDIYNRLKSVEGVVLGSSRVMKISPSELEARLGMRFFNFGVNNARSEDYLAIYRWIRSHDVRPKVILIGLDVEALHDDDQPDGQLLENASLMNALEAGQEKPWREIAQESLSHAKRIFCRYYAQDMARSAWAAIRPPQSHYTFDRDGLLHYVLWEQQISSGEFNLQTQLDEQREHYWRRFMDMKSLSEKRRRYLEQLLQEAKQDNVKVSLWITPIHPEFARYLAQSTQYWKLLEKTRAYVRTIGSRYDVRTFDFSEPAHFGGTDLDWYDGLHIDPHNASFIVQKISDGLKKDGL